MTKTKVKAGQAGIVDCEVRKVTVADLTLSPMNPRQEIAEFVVLYLVETQLLMIRSYHAGFMK